MRRQRVFALFALLLSIGLLVLVGEVALRLLGWGPPYFVFHPDIGYVIRPSSSFQVPAGSEGGTRLLVSNSHGLRDVEHAYEKSPGTRRILILGDSFCEAEQVDLEDTFFRVLQYELDTADGAGRYELINGGVSGYGTDRELLFYRHEGRKYSPDDVFLFFVFNDVRNNDREMQLQMYGDRNEPYFELTPSGGLEARNYPAGQSRAAAFRQVVRGNLYLYHFVWDLVQGARLSRRAVQPGTGVPFDYRMYEDPAAPEWDRAWTITAALLRELQAEVSRDGAHLVVVAVTNDLQLHPDHRERMFDEYPAMREMRWDWAQTHRRLGRICESAGIEWIDLLPRFLAEAERAPERHLHSFGGHWTAAGHRVAAEVLFERLSPTAAEESVAP